MRVDKSIVEMTVEEWDLHCFQRAVYFTVCSMVRREKSVHRTFAEARALASESERTLVYAVTADDRSVLLTRARWDEYAALAIDSPS
jgi:hypothetical protein